VDGRLGKGERFKMMATGASYNADNLGVFTPANQPREALKAGDTASKATIDSIGNYEKLMREKGVQIVDIDIKPFVASTSVVYEKLGYTDLRKQVNLVLAK